MEAFICDLYQHNSLQIKCLKMCGIWFYIPHHRKSIRFWFHLLCKIVMGVLVFVLPVTGQGIYLIKLIMSGQIEIHEAAGIINLVLTELLISLKLLDMRYRRDLLTELEAQMERKEFLHYSGRQKRIIEKGIKLSRKLYVWLIVIATMDITVHLIVVPAIHNFKVLPVKMDFIFFDVLEETCFKLIFIYQVIYKPILLLTFSSLQTMRWSYMICAISQLDVLIYNFENMKLDKSKNVVENDNTFGNAFKRCVIYHCAIRELISSIKRTFGGQFVLFFIINSCIICTTAVQFVSFKNPLSHIMELLWMFVFVFLLVIILFIDCHFGSTITQKNSHISTVVYCFPWITLPENMKKNLIIFIGINQRTLAINAAKLIPVSMATFTKVMNWTYKSFAVLNQMKK